MPAISSSAVSLVSTNYLCPRPLVPNRIGKHTDLYVARYLLNLVIDFYAHLKKLAVLHQWIKDTLFLILLL